MFDPVTVLAIAFKTSLLMVAVGLIALLLARQSAAWRHFLWTAALALSLLMPIAVVYLPPYVHVSLPWAIVETPASDAGVPPTAETNMPMERGAQELRTFDELAPVAGDVRVASEVAWWPKVVAIWLFGAMIVLLRNAVGHIRLIEWIFKTKDLSPAWAGTVRLVMSEAGYRRRLRVLETDRTTSPCTWGFIRPVLLLPAIGAEWPESQRRFALLHEIAHVRRHDYLTAQIANFACAMHWYNPFVWFAAAQASKFREQACDDAVLHAGGKASDYAQFLVGIAARLQRLPFASAAAVGMIRRSQLHERVRAILDMSRTRSPLKSLALFIAVAPLACLMLFLATLSAVTASVAAPVAAAAAPVTKVATPVAAAATPVAAAVSAAQDASGGATNNEIPLAAPFTSFELRNGGKIHLVHGQTQRVTLLQGDPDEVGITLRDDGRLIIDRCPARCLRHLEVEVMTPPISTIAVAEGGTIVSGAFPGQPAMTVSVSQGGTIDIRSMPAKRITAAVYSGGRIYLKAESSLTAAVVKGGLVTYWGDPVVTESVDRSAGVVRGNPADEYRPLTEFDPVKPATAPKPAVPALPAVPAEPPAPTVKLAR